MLTNQRHLFDLPEDGAYLNCAYMAPQLHSLTTLGHNLIGLKSNPMQIKREHFFEPVRRAKAAFAQLVHIDDPQRVAIIPSVSYGMANAAFNAGLQAGDEIVLTSEQFPSNYYIWERVAQEQGAKLRVVRAPNSPDDYTKRWNAAILRAINPKTRVVTLGHVHWADGTLFELEAIGAMARQHNALLIIDGTQSVGALPFDVKRIQPDALIVASYKWLFGPYAIGLAYYGPAFDQGKPIEENWINRLHAEDFRNLVNYQNVYQPGAARYSVGEQSNFIRIPMMTRALEQLLEWGVENIQQYCQAIASEAYEQMEALGCQVEPADRRAHHLVGVRLGTDLDLDALPGVLQERQVYVSLRGNAVRVAPHVYNSADDFQQLVAAFEAVRRVRI